MIFTPGRFEDGPEDVFRFSATFLPVAELLEGGAEVLAS